VVESASEAELADASAHADLDGLFTCPHTGVALAALTKLAARGEIRKDQRAIVISTASGLKFADFKVGYHEATLAGVPSPRYRNVPVELPEQYSAVREALLRGLDTPRA
jgi:threonine synthase